MTNKILLNTGSWDNEEKAETKSSHMLKEAEQSIKNAELSIQKAKQNIPTASYQ
ncbi:hypothetical protein [Acinetobacter baumannii]|uniref:hypothetical protein n=1 Tax=Acinetobacter baumannii TaxID=470 RepID=UPI001D186753|nr:hypothetical protein [Acinetobacter baumannii]